MHIDLHIFVRPYGISVATMQTLRRVNTVKLESMEKHGCQQPCDENTGTLLLRDLVRRSLRGKRSGKCGDARGAHTAGVCFRTLHLAFQTSFIKTTTQPTCQHALLRRNGVVSAFRIERQDICDPSAAPHPTSSWLHPPRLTCSERLPFLTLVRELRHEHVLIPDLTGFISCLSNNMHDYLPRQVAGF